VRIFAISARTKYPMKSAKARTATAHSARLTVLVSSVVLIVRQHVTSSGGAEREL